MPGADVTGFFDPSTFSVSYVVADPATAQCAVIDPVLDYNPRSGRTRTASADRVVAFVRERGLSVQWLLETHVHADHLTAAPYLRQALGGRTCIGSGVTEVQRTFARLFNCDGGFACDGSQFDRLFADGEEFAIGSLTARVLHTPGHTPACASYVVGDAAFVGDALFMPDYGTARCDFPGGSARILYRSVRRLLDLPPATRIFVGHDYGPGGRAFAWESTVAEQRACNKHLCDGVDEDAFVAMRETRDRTLDLPELILPAIQINMRAGERPPPEANGVCYIKVPLDAI